MFGTTRYNHPVEYASKETTDGRTDKDCDNERYSERDRPTHLAASKSDHYRLRTNQELPKTNCQRLPSLPPATVSGCHRPIHKSGIYNTSLFHPLRLPTGKGLSTDAAHRKCLCVYASLFCMHAPRRADDAAVLARAQDTAVTYPSPHPRQCRTFDM